MAMQKDGRMKRKMVLIGAGSAMFTKNLIVSLLENDMGIDWHLALVDIDTKILEIVHRVAKKIIEAKGASLTLTVTPDRTEALPGADIVVSTIGVGGRRAWEQDVFIPRKYGIFQPVGDGVGPGGISRAMRMIPATVDIAKDMQRLCPNAYFFNYANPMHTVCRGVVKATGFPIIGLCNGVSSRARSLAAHCGLDPDKATIMAIGVNHNVLMYDFRYNGEDYMPLVRKVLLEDNNLNPKRGLGPFTQDFLRKFPGFAVGADRHATEFIPQYLRKGEYFGKTLGVDADAYSFETTISWGDDIYEEFEKISLSEEPLPNDYINGAEGEQVELMNMIRSLIFDERKVFFVNIPNEGAVPSLPAKPVVEMPVLLTANGFVRLQINGYPDVFASMTAKYLDIGEITVDAALEGSRDLFVEAVVQEGHMLTRKETEQMVDELIAAQIAYLPQFQ